MLSRWKALRWWIDKEWHLLTILLNHTPKHRYHVKYQSCQSIRCIAVIISILKLANIGQISGRNPFIASPQGELYRLHTWLYYGPDIIQHIPIQNQWQLPQIYPACPHRGLPSWIHHFFSLASINICFTSGERMEWHKTLASEVRLSSCTCKSTCLMFTRHYNEKVHYFKTNPS